MPRGGVGEGRVGRAVGVMAVNESETETAGGLLVVARLLCRSGNKFDVKFQSVTVKVVVLQCIS